MRPRAKCYILIVLLGLGLSLESPAESIYEASSSCGAPKKVYLDDIVGVLSPMETPTQCVGNSCSQPQSSPWASFKSAVKSGGDENIKKCIYESMKRAPKKSTASGYYECKASSKGARTGGIPSGSERPCLTEPLVNTVADAFEEVGSCVGLDIKSVLPLFAHESQFVPNQTSASGASCIGQLTAAAISQVRQDYFDTGVVKFSKALKPLPVSQSRVRRSRLRAKAAASFSNSPEFQKRVISGLHKDFESRKKDLNKINQLYSFLDEGLIQLFTTGSGMVPTGENVTIKGARISINNEPVKDSRGNIIGYYNFYLSGDIRRITFKDARGNILLGGGVGYNRKRPFQISLKDFLRKSLSRKRKIRGADIRIEYLDVNGNQALDEKDRIKISYEENKSSQKEVSLSFKDVVSAVEALGAPEPPPPPPPPVLSSSSSLRTLDFSQLVNHVNKLNGEDGSRDSCHRLEDKIGPIPPNTFVEDLYAEKKNRCAWTENPYLCLWTSMLYYRYNYNVAMDKLQEHSVNFKQGDQEKVAHFLSTLAYNAGVSVLKEAYLGTYIKIFKAQNSSNLEPVTFESFLGKRAALNKNGQQEYRGGYMSFLPVILADQLPKQGVEDPRAREREIMNFPGEVYSKIKGYGLKKECLSQDWPAWEASMRGSSGSKK